MYYEIKSRLELEKGAFATENILKLLELYAKESKKVKSEFVADLIIEDFWKDLNNFYDTIHIQLEKYGVENVVETLTTFYDGKIIRRMNGLATFEKLLKIHIETFLLEIVNFTDKSWDEVLSKKELLDGIKILKEDNFTFEDLFY